MSADYWVLSLLIVCITVYNIIKVIVKSRRDPKIQIMEDLDELYDELEWQQGEQRIQYLKERVEVKKELLNIK